MRYSICKISDIARRPPFWNVLVSWYPHHDLDNFETCHVQRVKVCVASYVNNGYLYLISYVSLEVLIIISQLITKYRC